MTLHLPSYLGERTKMTEEGSADIVQANLHSSIAALDALVHSVSNFRTTLDASLRKLVDRPSRLRNKPVAAAKAHDPDEIDKTLQSFEKDFKDIIKGIHQDLQEWRARSGSTVQGSPKESRRALRSCGSKQGADIRMIDAGGETNVAEHAAVESNPPTKTATDATTSQNTKAKQITSHVPLRPIRTGGKKRSKVVSADTALDAPVDSSSILHRLNKDISTDEAPLDAETPDAISDPRTEADSGLQRNKNKTSQDQPRANASFAARTVEYQVPTFECRLDELGIQMASTLEKFCGNDIVQQTGMGRVRIDDFSLARIGMSNDTEWVFYPDKSHHTHNMLELDRELGICRVVSVPAAATDGETSMPSCVRFAESLKQGPVTITDAIGIFEKIAHSAAKSTVQNAYLIGPTHMLQGYNPHLDAGFWLKTALKHIVAGVNTSYLYASLSHHYTVTSMHIEDGCVSSVNEVLRGCPKIWLSVDRDSTATFESRVRALCQTANKKYAVTSCSQWLRHASLMFPPSKLDEWGVKYHVQVCGPGELIFTTPGTYHQVANLGANIAESSNFTTSDTSYIPKSYVWCSPRACGLTETIGKRTFHPSTALPSELAIYSLGKMKRPLADDSVERPSKLSRNREWFEDQNLLYRDSLDNYEWLQCCVKGSPAMLLSSILSLSTLRRMSDILNAWREPATVRRRSVISDTARKRATDRRVAEKHILILIQRIEDHELALRYVADSNGGNLPGSCIDQRLAETGKPNNEDERRVITKEKYKVTKWIDWCQSCGTGMLMLFPLQNEAPYYIKDSFSYKENSDFIEEFQRLCQDLSVLPTLKKLSAIGKTLERLYTGDVPFETQSEWGHSGAPYIPTKGDVNVDDIFYQFQIKPYRLRNVMVPHSKWSLTSPATPPSDPTVLSGVSKACRSTAPDASCSCIATRFVSDKVEILRTRQKWSGLRVCRNDDDFEKDIKIHRCEEIGELTGDLYPPYCHDLDRDMYYEIRKPPKYRSDIVIARLYFEKEGNFVRLVSHSCKDANATFTTREIGCRLRVVLEAKRDLNLGEQLLVNFNQLRGYFEKKTMQCTHCHGPCQVTQEPTQRPPPLPMSAP